MPTRLLPARIQEARGKRGHYRAGRRELSQQVVPAKRRRGGPRTPKKGATSKPCAALDRPRQQRQFQGLQTESLRVNWAHPNVVKWDTKFPGRRAHTPGSPSSPRFLALSCSPTNPAGVGLDPAGVSVCDSFPNDSTSCGLHSPAGDAARWPAALRAPMPAHHRAASQPNKGPSRLTCLPALALPLRFLPRVHPGRLIVKAFPHCPSPRQGRPGQMGSRSEARAPGESPRGIGAWAAGVSSGAPRIPEAAEPVWRLLGAKGTWVWVGRSTRPGLWSQTRRSQ